MFLNRNETTKISMLEEYFVSKFNNKNYEYGSEGQSIIRYPLKPDGSKLIVLESNRWPKFGIRHYEKSYPVATIIDQHPCKYDSMFEISFNLESSMNDGKSFKFDYVSDFHSKEFFNRIKKHLKLLNEAIDIHNKRSLIDFESETIKVDYFYRYERISNLISKCALITFKSYKNFPMHSIVILNDDNKFLLAIDEIEKEFQKRYYDEIIPRKEIIRGKFLTKKEQELIKMFYF